MIKQEVQALIHLTWYIARQLPLLGLIWVAFVAVQLGLTP